jgi:hypothetical protein
MKSEDNRGKSVAQKKAEYNSPINSTSNKKNEYGAINRWENLRPDWEI